MRRRIADEVVDIIERRDRILKPDFTDEELALAEWLRGDDTRLDTLLRFLAARIERRVPLPSSSTSSDVAIFLGRDFEARDIKKRLREIYSAPVNLGSDEENDG